MVRLSGGCVTLCLLLCAGIAYGHDSKSNQQGSAFVFDQGDDANVGEDAIAANLMNSIQGVFDDAPADPAAKPAAVEKATKPAAAKPVAPKKVETPSVAKKAVSPKPVAAKPAAVAKKAVSPKPVAAKPAAVAEKAVVAKPAAVAKKVAATKGSKPKTKATVAKAPQPKAAKPAVAKAKKIIKTVLLKVAPKVVKAAPKLAKEAVKVAPKLVNATPKVVKATPKPAPKVAPQLRKATPKVAPAVVKAAPKVAPKLVKATPKVAPKFVQAQKPVKAAPKVAPKVVKAAPAAVAKKSAKPDATIAKTMHLKAEKVAAKKVETAVTKPSPAKAVKVAPKPLAKVQVAEKAHLPAEPVAEKVTAKTHTKPYWRLEAEKKAKAAIAAPKPVAAPVVKATPAPVAPKPTAAPVPQAVQFTVNASYFGTVKIGIPVIKNSSQVDENATKVIEAAAVSLPMASFALEDTWKPVQNKTEPKFPGNATQKAAWEKKETDLEKEVASLKARLANTSETLDANKRVAPMASKATGTFNAHASKDGKDADAAKVASAQPAKAFMAARAPEPTQPILKPKAVVKSPDWPTMNSVAAPVALHLATAGAPPQKDAVQAQEGVTKKVTMGSTFTGTPEKKVESILALDATVEQDAAAVADDGSTASDSSDGASDGASDAPAPQFTHTSGMWGWFSSLFSWMSGSATSTAAVAKPVAHKQASLLDVTQKRWLKQDMLRTAQATKEESEHVIQVNDAWSQMEQNDNTDEDQVRREDAAERERAETPEAPHTPTKVELKGRHGADMSNFWGSLENEDYGIERSVDNEDLGEYSRLTQAQNVQVTQAAKQVETNKLSTERSPLLKHGDTAALVIHEPWLRKETRDILEEKKVHDSPDLQMLQLKHRHRRTQ